MAVIAASAVTAGLALTVSVPIVALHEMLVKRHKKQMQKHLPAMKKRVCFPCEAPVKQEPVPLPEPEIEVEEVKVALPAVPVEVSPLPAPPYKSLLRRPSPPPSYEDTFNMDKIAPLDPPRIRNTVRFAERA